MATEKKNTKPKPYPLLHDDKKKKKKTLLC